MSNVESSSVASSEIGSAYALAGGLRNPEFRWGIQSHRLGEIEWQTWKHVTWTWHWCWPGVYRARHDGHHMSISIGFGSIDCGSRSDFPSSSESQDA